MTHLKFHRMNKELTQKELSKLSKIKRWRLSLAEAGHLLLAQRELKNLEDALELETGALGNVLLDQLRKVELQVAAVGQS